MIIRSYGLLETFPHSIKAIRFRPSIHAPVAVINSCGTCYSVPEQQDNIVLVVGWNDFDRFSRFAPF